MNTLDWVVLLIGCGALLAAVVGVLARLSGLERRVRDLEAAEAEREGKGRLIKNWPPVRSAR